MINVIYGLKGSGKTNKIIDKANWRAASTNGKILYITDRPEHSKEIDKDVIIHLPKDEKETDEIKIYPVKLKSFTTEIEL